MENKQKLVQLVIVFNLLNKGKSMKNHEDFQVLFKFLKPRFVPQKHWYDGAGWKMAKHIIHEVRKMTKIVVQNAKFVSFTCMRSHPWIM